MNNEHAGHFEPSIIPAFLTHAAARDLAGFVGQQPVTGGSDEDHSTAFAQLPAERPDGVSLLGRMARHRHRPEK